MIGASMQKIEIGLRHKKARDEVLKMSGAEYAAAMQVKEVTVYSWESGRSNVPQEILAKLDEEFGVSAGWILIGEQRTANSEQRTTLNLIGEQLSGLLEIVEGLRRDAPEVVAHARGASVGWPRIPLLSLAVSAGMPVASDDTIESEIDLAEMLLEHPDSTYFIRVVGDSMTEAGIGDGDTLIVDCEISPRTGQVVIAKVFGELTVKRYLEVGGRPLLRAENVLYKDIEITEEMDFAIVGVVTSCIKKL